METIEFKGKQYPAFQANGHAARFCMPFAREVCVGRGYDIGCSKLEWAFDGAKPIDLTINDEWDATNLPDGEVDYIFSSHCLEHLNDWVGVLDYWTSKIKSGGTMFLYLPDYSQEYWRPFNNRKHCNILTPTYLRDYFEAREYKNIFVSGIDAYNSFTAFAEKA